MGQPATRKGRTIQCSPTSAARPWRPYIAARIVAGAPRMTAAAGWAGCEYATKRAMKATTTTPDAATVANTPPMRDQPCTRLPFPYLLSRGHATATQIVLHRACNLRMICSRRCYLCMLSTRCTLLHSARLWAVGVTTLTSRLVSPATSIIGATLLSSDSLSRLGTAAPATLPRSPTGGAQRDR